MSKIDTRHIGSSIKKVVGILAALVVFAGIVRGLDFLYVGLNDSTEWCRILWHNFYKDKGKIDNIYVGSSHVHYDLDPMMLDDLTGQYNFNLSSPFQRMDGTYFLLREADRNNDLKHAYVELYYEVNVENRDNSLSWMNMDHMKMSFNKLAYVLYTTEPVEYPNVLFPFVRYREKLADWKYIEGNIESKQQKAYRFWQYREEYSDGNGYFEAGERGRGYCTRVYYNEDRLYTQWNVLGKDPMKEVSKTYLRKVIEYCRDRNIPLTLFVSPISNLQLVSTQGYDHYIDQVREIAGEYNVPFYDFNLAKEEYLPIWCEETFSDAGHLNNTGAEMFTRFFYDVVFGEKNENAQYFYESYAEKLKETPPEIYGLYYIHSEDIEQPQSPRIMRIASNRDSGMEYKVTLTTETGEQYEVQDFEENNVFTVPRGENSVCTVSARMKERPDEIQTMEIKCHYY